MTSSDGSLSPAGALDVGNGLDFVTLGPDDRTLFVSDDGAVTAFSYDLAGEDITQLDSASTSGGGTHVAVDPTGRYVFVAHYNQGALSFLRFAPGTGFEPAQTFRPGDNAHQVQIGGSGNRVYVPCLGDNHVAAYTLNPSSGTLAASSPASVAAAGGPRHMAFHPSAPVAYVLTELSSQIHVYDVDSATGSLTARPSDSVYTSLDQQGHWSSDIQVTPDGKFVYAVNRDPREIVGFRVEAGHALTRLGASPLTSVVRAFAIDPRGEYVQIGGEDGRLAALRIQRDTGALQETSAESSLGNIHATIIRYLSP